MAAYDREGVSRVSVAGSCRMPMLVMSRMARGQTQGERVLRIGESVESTLGMV